MIKRAHVFIYGDVIGIGFRAWAVRNAENLGLAGWVRNVYEVVYPERSPAPYGAGRSRRVEAVFEGEEGKVKEVIERCKSGPSTAWIEKVEVKWAEATYEFEGFEIRY